MNDTPVDVVDDLARDHRSALDQLDRITTGEAPDRRRELADTVIAEIVRHTVAEEMYVHPAMRLHFPDGEEAVERDLVEHAHLGRAVTDLEGADVDAPDFPSLVRAVREAWVRHAEHEQRHQFPQLRQRVPADELESIRRRVEQLAREAPTRPQPGATDAALLPELVGPGEGMVNRIRDRLTGGEDDVDPASVDLP